MAASVRARKLMSLIPSGPWRISRWVAGSTPMVAVPVGADSVTEVLAAPKPVDRVPLALVADVGSVRTRPASDDHAIAAVPAWLSSRHVGSASSASARSCPSCTQVTSPIGAGGVNAHGPLGTTSTRLSYVGVADVDVVAAADVSVTGVSVSVAGVSVTGVSVADVSVGSVAATVLDPVGSLASVAGDEAAGVVSVEAVGDPTAPPVVDRGAVPVEDLDLSLIHI